MKVEYLTDKSLSCPLIRLYEFNQVEAQSLRNLVRSLVAGECQGVALQGKVWAKSVGGCRLTLRQGTLNQGIHEVARLNFECVLNADGWSNVEGLLDPFCDSDTTGFQWLTQDGSVSLLISQSGRW